MNKNSPLTASPEQSRGALQIAGIYLLIGSLWILFSDRLAAGIAPDTVALTSISIYKGWGYVLVTASLLYWLIRRNNTALERNYRQLLSFIEQAPLSIAMFDREMSYLATSRRWIKEYGRGYPELVGRNHYEVHPDLPDNWKDAHRKGLAGENLKKDEDLWIQADGTKNWLRWAIAPWTDDHGQIGGIIISAEDITEGKQAEAEIVKLNEELEQRVIERTSQLTAVNQELESFSYSVSHDLRAPLRAIDGYARILTEDHAAALDGEGQRVCGVISQEAQRMGQLIDDLLTFSRLSRREIQPVQIDMQALVHSVFNQLRQPEAHRQVEFQLGDLHPITGDATLMRQVWTNLLANALKFTSGRQRAVIEVGSSQNESEVEFFVRDNGAGFDMEYVDKLFGVFQRLHSEAEFEGTGVGLAIVQRVIRRHGGRVWAEGKVDEGAAFHFALPLKGARTWTT